MVKSNWRITITKNFPRPVKKKIAYGLNTHNYGELLRGILTGVAAGGLVSVNMVDVNGVSRNLYIKYGSTSPDWFWTYGMSGAHAELLVLAQLGDGNSPPSRSDRDLQNPFAGFAVMGTTYNNGVVTLTGSVTYGSPLSPREVGLFMEMSDGSYGGKVRYLLDRTTFSPLPAGTTFTIRYDINLG